MRKKPPIDLDLECTVNLPGQLGSYSSGPLAARTVGTKSTGGLHQGDGSPCTLPSTTYPAHVLPMRHSTRKSEQDLEISVVVMSLGNHGVQIEYKLSLFEDLNRSNVYAAVMLPSKLRISVPPSLHSLLMSLLVSGLMVL